MRCSIRHLLIVFSLSGGFASQSLAHSDLDLRIQEVTARLQTNRNDIELLLKRAELHRLHADWNAAHADYALARSINPDSRTLSFGVALLLTEEGRREDAKAAWDKFLQQYPDNGDALLCRAQVLEALGQTNAAIGDYDKALDCLEQPQPDHYLARARLQAVAEGPEAALAGVDEGLRKLGMAVTLQKCAVELELGAGATNSALLRLEQIMAHSRRHERWLAWRGGILLQAGRFSDATEAYQLSAKCVAELPARIRESTEMQSLAAEVQAALKCLGERSHKDENPAR